MRNVSKTANFLNRPVLLKGKPAFANITYAFLMPAFIGWCAYKISDVSGVGIYSILVGIGFLLIGILVGARYVSKKARKDEMFFQKQIHEFKLLLFNNIMSIRHLY